MSSLEEIQPGSIVRGIIPGSIVTVVSVKKIGPDILNVFVKDSNGKMDERLLYRSDETHIEIISCLPPLLHLRTEKMGTGCPCLQRTDNANNLKSRQYL